MSQKRPQAGERYLHFKNKLYQVLTIATHSETGEELVIYQALYGNYRVYARPLAMFTGEVDHEKYPGVAQKYRFQLVSGERAEEPAEEPEKFAEKPRAAVSEGAADKSGEPVPERPQTMQQSRFVTERKTVDQAKSERRSQFARQPRSPLIRKAPAASERKEASAAEELLMAFYDAATYGRKYQILLQMEGRVTDLMIDNMAMVMDVTIPEGPVEKRYEELKRCVRTYEKYETGRGY